MPNPQDRYKVYLFHQDENTGIIVDTNGKYYLSPSQVEQDEQEGAYLIYQAAELGNKEAKDWIDDYTFDDDAGVQADS